MGYSEIGCYGQKLIETPNIDNLAQKGKLFTNAYAGSPVSASSRCSLMTGLHAGHATSEEMTNGLRKEMCGTIQKHPTIRILKGKDLFPLILLQLPNY